jgi:hypothetical protein
VKGISCGKVGAPATAQLSVAEYGDGIVIGSWWVEVRSLPGASSAEIVP